MKFISDQAKELLLSSKNNFLKNKPYPFIIIDNFLEKEIANICNKNFSEIENGWISYKHYNQNKRGNQTYIKQNYLISELTKYLNSKAFIDILCVLTNYKKLKGDNSLDGGGLHETKKGGYLNIHTDFQNHTNYPNLQRKINLLLYFDNDLQNMKNANLELWDKSCSKMAQSIEPIYNRCVIFSTENPSFHGHPKPLITHKNNSRKSLALYYYFDANKELPIISTNYKSVPTDKFLKKLIIRLDNFAVNTYSKLKRKKIINDELFTKILKKLGLD